VRADWSVRIKGRRYPWGISLWSPEGRLLRHYKNVRVSEVIDDLVALRIRRAGLEKSLAAFRKTLDRPPLGEAELGRILWMLHDEDARVRRTALAALAGHGHRVHHALRRMRGSIRDTEARRAIGRLIASQQLYLELIAMQRRSR